MHRACLKSLKSPKEFSKELVKAAHHSPLTSIMIFAGLQSKTMVYLSNRPKGKPVLIQEVLQAFICFPMQSLTHPGTRISPVQPKSDHQGTAEEIKNTTSENYQRAPYELIPDFHRETDLFCCWLKFKSSLSPRLSSNIASVYQGSSQASVLATSYMLGSSFPILRNTSFKLVKASSNEPSHTTTSQTTESIQIEWHLTCPTRNLVIRVELRRSEHNKMRDRHFSVKLNSLV
ncbi:uncharacterized protein LOC112176259 [Rosa chinensis]|uniref:uncharacterized protein LOC112176259 n=1 Tax=Rosa chinensis TaxID=74649 RepID=UPI000D0907B2|nr:uncharacterized protein LOC112176259 [Rosa chinensis]